ncbi:MAG: O-antigen ligase domain-containing protein [Chitinophagia bacterium]|nr:O-antigen ligase domain-containing protein [Chitinophagia bacterium]
MRFTYWNTYWDLLCKNPWLGVGSGDLDQVAKPLFKDHPLEIPFNRPHNQWLELGVHLGFPAILISLGAWALWWSKRCLDHQSLWEAMALVWFLSTWLDCTWSTQAGLSAFMGLNLALLLVDEPRNQGP